MANESKYKWNYCSVGGVVRVNIQSGEDIAHLGELDQKLWTVLSCPVDGLEFDHDTLRLLDTDGDGKIRVAEVVAAAQWLTSAVRDKDSILKGESVLSLDQINTDTPVGQTLHASARQILSNLGKDAASISIDDTKDSVAIFAGTKLNGDGIVTEASTDDADLKSVISAVIATVGSCTDRSGAPGVNAGQVETFYSALADYAAWRDAADADRGSVLPYGDNTAAALAACEELNEKVSDYFMRCKLISFDADAAAAVDVSVEKISAISGLNLSTCSDEIAQYPLARPTADGVLPLDAVNPAWKSAFDRLKSLVLDVELPGKTGITEADWSALMGRFSAYKAWMGAKKGAEVEGLGIDAVKAMLAADRKSEILAIIDADKALESESKSIDEVNKLMHFYRDFYKFLSNYVIFSDFYSKKKAVFQIGKLYVDQRCCDLCIRVTDMGKHADMARLSGLFLIYCSCTSKAKGEKMDIVAAMTDGSIENLRPGVNGVFYDREGRDWDAVITKVVDNPVSISQAFWSPYRKLGNFVEEKINKAAAEKDTKVIASLQTKVDTVSVPAAGEPVKPPFDIAKFAGITAAIGMAVGAVGVAVSSIFKGLFSLKLWQLVLLIVGLMTVISGPACFLAWKKLRKRNLGPVLNANGWAVNSDVLINILFGNTLTSVAKYPKMRIYDPYSMKVPAWKRILRWLIVLIIAAFASLYFTDHLRWMGIERKPLMTVVETAAEAASDAPASDAPSDIDPAVTADQFFHN